MLTHRSANKLFRYILKFGQQRHIDITDEYVRWLQTINVGFLHYGNLYSFNYAIQRLPSGAPLLEIGSYCGLSTNLLIYYKRKNGVKNSLFTCDKWEFEDASHIKVFPETDISMEKYRDFVKATYLRNVAMFSRDDLPYTIEALSDEFFSEWNKRSMVTDVFGRTVNLGGTFSFVYIDGNHTYEFSKRDCENSDRFLERGGFILFDDSSDAGKLGSSRAAREAAFSRSYEIVVKNPNYLLRKR